jgi:ABC-type sugar transport system ATPase subunit
MQNISKRFGAVQALDGVSLTVRAGTVHALVGENGAGKSTLMKILAGVHRPDGGSVRVLGHAWTPSGPAEALSGGVAMIHQELSLAADMTVAENVYLGREPRGWLPGTVDHRAMIECTRRLAQARGFEIDPCAQVEELSVADRQIVEVLRALARDASILVMDEPTSALGHDEAEAMLGLARSLGEAGVTVIYISHRLGEVMSLAEEVTVLRDGRSVHTGPVAGLEVADVVRHMVGRELRDFYPPRSVELGPVRLSVEGLATESGLAEISFVARAGEVVGFAGLVGAGRTALARALFGVEPSSAGSITFDDRPLVLCGPADAWAAGMMYVTEDRARSGLCLGLPAAWNVTLPCLRQLGMSRLIRPARENRLVSDTAARLSLRWAGPEAPASSLSGGNQQKLLLARALLADSQLIILDEPTRGIDIAAKADIYRLLGELAAAGKTILLISSELPELLGVTDRLLVMRRGRLAGELRTAAATPETVMRLAATDGTSS